MTASLARRRSAHRLRASASGVRTFHTCSPPKARPKRTERGHNAPTKRAQFFRIDTARRRPAQSLRAPGERDVRESNPNAAAEGATHKLSGKRTVRAGPLLRLFRTRVRDARDGTQVRNSGERQ
ncbi:hypothetical protein PSP6_150046 [Paraburkholderia tropica]|nr:hypothetical protein PSP6_150046 [Paraburkholderia tropica]